MCTKLFVLYHEYFPFYVKPSFMAIQNNPVLFKNRNECIDQIQITLIDRQITN